MINKVWAFFIVVGSVFCLMTGKTDVLNAEILESSKTSLDMIFQLFPVMALWLGIMNIAKKSGLLERFAQMISPLLSRLFPEIPKGHESLSYIASNIVVNMAGLGSAATPFGLKAMKSLQEINPKKDTASRSMITFLVLNTSGVTLIPITIISLRMMYHSTDPTGIVLACILATLFSTIGGLTVDRLVARRKNHV